MKHMIVGIVAAVMMAGCSSKSNFYQLHASHYPSTESDTRLKPTIVGIAEVEVADYLDKPQIVTRLSAGHVKLHEEERWAGSLDKNIQSLLAYNLSRSLPRYTFLSQPWEEPVSDAYRIYVNLDRFDGDLNGTVVLSGRWSLVDPEENRLILGEKVHYVDRGAPTIDGIVATQSRLIDRLSARIAKKIRGRM